MLYEKFKKLDIDFSQLGLKPGDTRSDYFCTPKGAEVIGWAGVDGIHYCFVKGFGEMVFAVNPSNLPGDYVHPLARNFEDFLRLILACGLDAAEQAWMWNRGEFDAFMETYLPVSEQRAALDGLRDELGLTPMDDPYEYIREVQYGFDYSKIPYSEEYYDLVPEKTQEPPERPEWKVYFDNGFSSHHTGHDKPGKEFSVNQTFTWSGKVWHIPTAYVCGKGLVVDLCMEVDTAELRSFMEKWWPFGEEECREFTPEEREQQDAEDPMNMDFTPRLTVNGKELRRKSGNGFGWVPVSCRPKEERGKPTQQDWESLWLMEHYGLDSERGWAFWRESFTWATKAKPTLKTVSLSLEQNPVSVPGPRFTVSGVGDIVPFINPVTGEAHTLHVVEYEAQQMDANHFQDKNQWEYPTRYTAMSFTVEPELPRQSLTVRDSGQGDRPRLKHPDIAGPTIASSVGIILANSKISQTWTVCSSLYFEQPGQIEWRMVFRQKTVEDIELDMILFQNRNLPFVGPI